MDHGYIDEHSVALRYLDHALTAEERAEFEGHLVDCAECTDRLLLAEMFQVRNGHGASTHPEPPRVNPEQEKQEQEKPPEIPLRARFVAQFRPWQLFLIFIAAAILLMLVPVAYFLWAAR